MTKPAKKRTRKQAPRKTRRLGGARQWETQEARLRERGSALRSDISRELRKYRAERDGLVGSNVPDGAELSTADLVADIYLSEVDRDVAELIEIEHALARLALGRYGYCVDCGGTIARRRLEETPHAGRCLECQQRAESALDRAATL